MHLHFVCRCWTFFLFSHTMGLKKISSLPPTHTSLALNYIFCEKSRHREKHSWFVVPYAVNYDTKNFMVGLFCLVQKNWVYFRLWFILPPKHTQTHIIFSRNSLIPPLLAYCHPYSQKQWRKIWCSCGLLLLIAFSFQCLINNCGSVLQCMTHFGEEITPVLKQFSFL